MHVFKSLLLGLFFIFSIIQSRIQILSFLSSDITILYNKLLKKKNLDNQNVFFFFNNKFNIG
jgi:hypothetical protein